jgi:uncharacterized metal-binding protein
MTDQIKLYSKEDLAFMRAAEDSWMHGINRIEEIKKFANLSGIKKIGIAHCIGMTKEANQLKQRLSETFEVVTVDCKHARVPASLMLNDENEKGSSCNPAGQADFLAQQQTELNLIMGLCVGHDIIFNMKSKAPTSTLIVKDREHHHNPFQEFQK